MLQIKNLYVNSEIDNLSILKGINLAIKQGEIHAIMGKNGSGKSTLAKVLSGSPHYKIISGEIIYKDLDITKLEPEKRAHLGIFLGFQNPIEIEGLNNFSSLYQMVKSVRKANSFPDISPNEFLQTTRDIIKKLKIDFDLEKRNVNEDFSGGEKKLNEILQMKLLNPNLIILDEIDSGLDIDALKKVTANLNEFKSKDKSFLLITHYQRLLDLFPPDFVHIMKDGQIIKTGNKELGQEVDDNGYDIF